MHIIYTHTHYSLIHIAHIYSPPPSPPPDKALRFTVYWSRRKDYHFSIEFLILRRRYKFG